jgi:phosphoglucomutase
MKALRTEGKTVLPDVVQVLDYNGGIGDLPKSDVLKFILHDGSWIAVRPSGTEPKLKIYYSVKQPDRDAAQQKLAQLRAAVKKLYTKTHAGV